jgi:hypothetical protein
VNNITLIRDDQNEIRTLGAMFDGEERICETLELPWKNNQSNISCIPERTYQCKIAYSPIHGYDVYWILNVPNRSAVEIHIGNFAKDTKGCILLGTTRAHDCILRSKIAFNKFMEKMAKNDFALTISKLDRKNL